jgi:hypothetical protein
MNCTPSPLQRTTSLDFVLAASSSYTTLDELDLGNLSDLDLQLSDLDDDVSQVPSTQVRPQVSVSQPESNHVVSIFKRSSGRPPCSRNRRVTELKSNAVRKNEIIVLPRSTLPPPTFKPNRDPRMELQFVLSILDDKTYEQKSSGTVPSLQQDLIDARDQVIATTYMLNRSNQRLATTVVAMNSMRETHKRELADLRRQLKRVTGTKSGGTRKRKRSMNNK